MENRRETFRARLDVDAEIFHEGRVVACNVTDLSAGGARIESGIELPIGTQCTLGMRLGDELARATGTEYLSWHLEVLDRTELPGDLHEYRVRSLSTPGSDAYEAAHKVVFEAHRRALAAERGTEDASPMASDEERREQLREPDQARFSRSSLRPGVDE